MHLFKFFFHKHHEKLSRDQNYMTEEPLTFKPNPSFPDRSTSELSADYFSFIHSSIVIVKMESVFFIYSPILFIHFWLFVAPTRKHSCYLRFGWEKKKRIVGFAREFIQTKRLLPFVHRFFKRKKKDFPFSFLSFFIYLFIYLFSFIH